jgi:hypothetical protein
MGVEEISELFSGGFGKSLGLGLEFEKLSAGAFHGLTETGQLGV